ncbi:rod-binding protein [Shimia gijangensis]|nr:rod-binding protein [Shimia gijangensis]
MKLRNAAIELEANFLSEMLKGAGLGQSPDGFGGGTGEDQFSSLLRLEQARAMAKAGGIGLAETLYQALKDTSDDP